jgi:hypothetical protein
MNIRLRDERMFTGTPLQIVRQMQSLTPGQQKAPLAHFVGWLVADVARSEGVALAVSGPTNDALAAALVEAMLAAGLAEKIV